jgi:hypothetical protein
MRATKKMSSCPRIVNSFEQCITLLSVIILMTKSLQIQVNQ